jgi:hypothetical protein
MNDKQLGFMYAFCAMLAVLVYVAVEMTDKPTSAEHYADKLCSELYGPQVGATWEKGTLMCESARGEIIEVRSVK